MVGVWERTDGCEFELECEFEFEFECAFVDVDMEVDGIFRFLAEAGLYVSNGCVCVCRDAIRGELVGSHSSQVELYNAHAQYNTQDNRFV